MTNLKPLLTSSRFGFRGACLCILIGHLLLSASLAQTKERKKPPAPTVQPKSRKDSPPSIRPSRQRIMQVLWESADRAAEFEDPAASAKVLAKVADLTWEADRETSVRYLVKAWERAGRVEELSVELSPFRNHSLRSAAQREVLMIARKLAPEIAAKWVEEMAEEEQEQREKSRQPRGLFDDRTPRSSVLLGLGLQVATENPVAATELAIESLRDGISFGFQSLLLTIQQKNPDLAQKAFRAALARLRALGTADPNELLILYSYLYSPGVIRASGTTEDRRHVPIAIGRERPKIQSAAQLNPALAAEFIEVASVLLLALPLPGSTADPQTFARQQFSVIRTILPKAEEVLPDRAILLQARLKQIEVDARFVESLATAPQGQPEPNPGESPSEYEKRRIESIEEQASHEKSSLSRDLLYAQAALSIEAESYEKSGGLARKIEDTNLRKEVSDLIYYRAALLSVQKDDLQTAYLLLQKNEDAKQKAAGLVVAAQKLVQRKDMALAAEKLTEARTLLFRKGSLDDEQVHIGFGIIAVWGKFDQFAARYVFSSLLEQIPEHTRLIPGTSAPQAVRFSGFNFPDFTAATEGFGLQAALKALPVEEFEMTLYDIRNLKNPIVRETATVILCQSLLGLSLPTTEAKAKPAVSQRKPSP